MASRMSNADEAYLKAITERCYVVESALASFLFSFTDVENKEGYGAALTRFIAAKQQARVVLGMEEADDE